MSGRRCLAATISLLAGCTAGQQEQARNIPDSPGKFEVVSTQIGGQPESKMATLIQYRGPGADSHFASKLREYCGGDYTIEMADVALYSCPADKPCDLREARSAIFHCNKVT